MPIPDLCILECVIGASLSEPHTSESNGGFFIGASLSEPHTSESNGGFFIYYQRVGRLSM